MLTNQEAKTRLLAVADETMLQHKKNLPNISYLPAMLHTEFILSMLCCVSQLIYFLYTYLNSHDNRYFTALAESLLMLFVALWNLYLYVTEARLTQLEVGTRIQTIVDGLRESPVQDIKIPTTIPTITVARVLRDGIVQILPFTLLVEGDIILLAVGDSSPAQARNIPKNSPVPSNISPKQGFPELILERGAILSKKATSKITSFHGFYYFQLLETPLKYTLEASLSSERPETIIMWQLKKLQQLLIKKIVWVFFGISLGINIIRFGVRVWSDINAKDQAIEMILTLQVGMLIVVLPLWLPTMCLAARSYGNAQILSLLEELQKSKVKFEDKEDVDEFDAAPPPTKDIVTDWNSIFQKFLDQLIRFDVDFLARTTGLIESFANTTVICAIDRDGTISMAYPTVDKLFFVGDKAEAIVLDVVELPHTIKFEDSDWEKYLNFLKPLGLNILLNSDCVGGNKRRKDESHHRFNRLPVHGHVHHARQTCLCNLSRAIGFSDQVVNNYVSKKFIQTFSSVSTSDTLTSSSNSITSLVDDHVLPNFFTQIFEDKMSNQFHSFSDGDVEIILSLCENFWNGTDLSPMNESVNKKITEFYQNALISDSYVVAYSYDPLFKREAAAYFEDKMTNPLYVEYKNGEKAKAPLFNTQTFVCLAAFRSNPKPNVVDFVEDLGLAGIRFVYFSPFAERESKAFAERLGLEIDWNACILLSSADGNGGGYRELHDIKAQLPKGVDNIRKHIEDVDDIPLHVSLFAECSPKTTAEMIKILQEHGEVVCCIGSSMNVDNIEIFSLADIAVSIDPTAASKEWNYSHRGAITTLAAGSLFSTIPCAVSLHYDTSLYSLTQIIREARTIAENCRQGFGFYLGTMGCLATALLLSYILGLPPLFTGYQLMWLTWLIIPVISTSFVFTSPDRDMMTFMPVKHTKQLKNAGKFFCMFSARFIFLVLVILAIFISLVDTFSKRQGLKTFGYDNNSWKYMLAQTPDDYKILVLCQTITMFVFVVHIIVMSSSFMRRIRYIHKASPLKNLIWLICCIICFLLQIVYCLAIILTQTGSYFLDIRWYTWLIAFSTIPINLAIQEFLKRYDIHDFSTNQRRLKLEFNTKLGMHSPL